jgi:hypothetical protein
LIGLLLAVLAVDRTKVYFSRAAEEHANQLGQPVTDCLFGWHLAFIYLAGVGLRACYRLYFCNSVAFGGPPAFIPLVTVVSADALCAQLRGPGPRSVKKSRLGTNCSPPGNYCATTPR